MNWLRHSTQGFQKSRTSRAGTRPAHLFIRRFTLGLPAASRQVLTLRPCEQPYGTTRTLLGWNPALAQDHVPAPLGSTPITALLRYSGDSDSSAVIGHEDAPT